MTNQFMADNIKNLLVKNNLKDILNKKLNLTNGNSEIQTEDQQTSTPNKPPNPKPSSFLNNRDEEPDDLVV